MRSPWPDPEVPDTDLTSHVLRHASELAVKPALVDAPSGRTLSFEQLAGGARGAAAGLAARGFGPGDVLTVHMPNLPEYAVAAHAAISLGGVVSTANPLYTADELAHQLEDSGARALLTVPPFLATALEAAERAGCDDVLVLGEGEGATPFAALFEHGREPPRPDIDPGSTAALLYSSGTTGLPKGVELSHRALLANVVQSHTALALDSGDTCVAVAPFFHALGFVILMNASLAAGATVVSLPRFELEAFLQTIQDHRATFTIVVPPIALGLAHHPAVDRFDVSSLRFVGCGAAPLGIESQRACAERLGCLVEQGYGMTEMSAGIAISSMDESVPNGPGQVGILLPGTEARVLDPDTAADLGPDATGELIFRGPQLMTGYLGRPEATAATIDPDGWLHSGDVGRVDEDGRVYVTDRLKELIKYKGYQVAPAEIEALLAGHPQISAAAVIGAPDEEAGELPIAFVVVSGDFDDAALISWVAERVAPHKRIRRVERVGEIPCSPSGKILRRELRARL